jgi:hypothetical protein
MRACPIRNACFHFPLQNVLLHYALMNITPKGFVCFLTGVKQTLPVVKTPLSLELDDLIPTYIENE